MLHNSDKHISTIHNFIFTSSRGIIIKRCVLSIDILKMSMVLPNILSIQVFASFFNIIPFSHFLHSEPEVFNVNDIRPSLTQLVIHSRCFPQSITSSCENPSSHSPTTNDPYNPTRSIDPTVAPLHTAGSVQQID